VSARAAGTTTAAVAADDIVDDVENRHDDRDDSGYDNHEHIRDGSDNSIDCVANCRNDSTHCNKSSWREAELSLSGS